MHRHITPENLDRVLMLFANIRVIEFFKANGSTGKELIRCVPKSGSTAKPGTVTTTTVQDIK
jgi:hypothetical protein